MICGDFWACGAISNKQCFWQQLSKVTVRPHFPGKKNSPPFSNYFRAWLCLGALISVIIFLTLFLRSMFFTRRSNLSFHSLGQLSRGNDMRTDMRAAFGRQKSQFRADCVCPDFTVRGGLCFLTILEGGLVCRPETLVINPIIILFLTVSKS